MAIKSTPFSFHNNNQYIRASGRVCHESQNYAFCIQALESDPKTPAAKDYMDLAVISLNLGISNATDTRSYINDMYESPGTDPSKKPALKGCISGYDGAVGSFKVLWGTEAGSFDCKL
ncbi:hypothetical protein CK203_018087 [Vitis vinifera]|uniref:Pectinesterase inhibitor domain-containing protein n=1 Tax=Vitis vinifera TaxID=29760 RepID=A0A438JW31_VITVI|nr:hypothetical protein CK203_018087 [Vitis vinifera]